METPAPAPASTRGVLSLVFAILAITGWCPCIGSVLAIVLGAGDRSSVGRAGVILGWLSIAFWVLMAGFVVFVAVVAAFVEAVS